MGIGATGGGLLGGGFGMLGKGGGLLGKGGGLLGLTEKTRRFMRQALQDAGNYVQTFGQVATAAGEELGVEVTSRGTSDSDLADVREQASAPKVVGVSLKPAGTRLRKLKGVQDTAEGVDFTAAIVEPPSPPVDQQRATFLRLDPDTGRPVVMADGKELVTTWTIGNTTMAPGQSVLVTTLNGQNVMETPEQAKRRTQKPQAPKDLGPTVPEALASISIPWMQFTPPGPIPYSASYIEANPELSRAASFTVTVEDQNLVVDLGEIPRGSVDEKYGVFAGGDTIIISSEGVYQPDPGGVPNSTNTTVRYDWQARYTWGRANMVSDVVSGENEVTITYGFRWYKDYIFTGQHVTTTRTWREVPTPGPTLYYAEFSVSYGDYETLRETSAITDSIKSAKITRTYEAGEPIYTIEEVAVPPDARGRVLAQMQIITPRADETTGLFNYWTGSSSDLSGGYEYDPILGYLPVGVFTDTTERIDLPFAAFPYTPIVTDP